MRSVRRSNRPVYEPVTIAFDGPGLREAGVTLTSVVTPVMTRMQRVLRQDVWESILFLGPRRTHLETIRRRADVDRRTLDTVTSVRIYTRTTRAQVVALCEAVRYLTASGIPGDLAECGVWRGGSMLAAARTLIEAGDRSRELWLYDTFSGVWHDAVWRGDAGDAVSLPAVQRTIAKAGYPEAHLRYIVGPLMETIPNNVPGRIALLRMGNDRYEPARHALEHLVPRMAPGAVLIVDDYGQSRGVRRAVDEYLETTGTPLLLHRIDAAARIGVLAAPAHEAVTMVSTPRRRARPASH